MKFPASPAAAALAALILLAPATASAQRGGPAPGSGTRPAPARMAAGAPLPKGSALTTPLPDTTLARIYFASGRVDVGITEMRRAAYKLDASPDSLTPEAAREVLGLLVQQAILTHRVREEPRSWSAADSADYRLLEDRLTLGAALDSAIAELGFAIATRGDSVPDKNALGIMVRDSAIARLAPHYDETAVASLAAAYAARPQPPQDLPPVERLRRANVVPAVSREDSARTLATSSIGSCTVGQVLGGLGRMNPLRRPPVRGAEDVRALARNTLFESLLRGEVRRQRIAQKPRVAAPLAERAEFLDLQRFVTRNVYDRVALDSTTLRRHFLANHARFVTPGRAVVVQTVFDSQAEADTLALRLTVPGYAESLATRSASAGIPYQATLEEGVDTTLFGRMRRAGEGAVLGPDSVRAGWRVLKVMSLVERADPSFGEAFARVRNDWREREGERRMRELISRLTAATIVRANDRSPYLTGRRRIPR